jgi:serine/threonine protein kinase
VKELLTEAQAQKRFTETTLPGGFRVGRVCGRGVFAFVFEGQGPTGERVAIKVANRLDDQAVRRFHREIKVSRELPPSENVVGYRAHGMTPDQRPFLAMEFVDGSTLGAVLAPGQALGEAAACALMLQLCKSFAGLHRLGIAHRDVKPDNIMITHRPRIVKLMDFGLVRDAQGILKLFEQQDVLEGHDFSESLDAGMLAGTPEYMAPEQISDTARNDEDGRTDTQADVYGLGAIFYQLLSGRKPFPLVLKKQTERTLLKELPKYLVWRLAQTDDDLQPLEGLNPNLWSILQKALRHDPKHRQGDAMELYSHVERYVHRGEGVLEDDMEETMAFDMKKLSEVFTEVDTLDLPVQKRVPSVALRVPAKPRPEPVGPPPVRAAEPAPQPGKKGLLVLVALGAAVLTAALMLGIFRWLGVI